MLLTLEVLTVVLAVVALVPALAHALELPGKLRLGKEQYLAVQPIYYPGFTFAGIAEPLSILAALVLLVTIPGTAQFWLVAGALAALAGMHAIFWMITQPVNKYWLRQTELSKPAKRFFGSDSAGAPPDWISLRDRWEYSHVSRAVAAMLALLLLVIAVAL
jgi:hypothetical protein